VELCSNGQDGNDADDDDDDDDNELNVQKCIFAETFGIVIRYFVVL